MSVQFRKRHYAAAGDETEAAQGKGSNRGGRDERLCIAGQGISKAEEATSARENLRHIERGIECHLWIKTLVGAATVTLSWGVLAAICCQNVSFWARAQFGSIAPFLAVAVGLAIIQFSLASVLEPPLMGSSLNLSPMAIIVSLAVCGTLWAVAGMFLSVPLMVIVMIVCGHFAAT